MLLIRGIKINNELQLLSAKRYYCSIALVETEEKFCKVLSPFWKIKGEEGQHSQ